MNRYNERYWTDKWRKVEKALDSIFDRCQDPNHIPRALLLVIRPGTYVDFTCPTCGHVTRVYGTKVTC